MELDRSLVVFLPAGDPNSDKTVEFMLAAEADVVELGVPFSDPVADGTTIQRSYARALSAGFRVEETFAILRKFRKHSDTPVVVMSYFNPIFRLGMDEFASQASESGANAILVVDLPVDEANDWVEVCRDQGLGTVFLAAPNTSDERLTLINELSDFVYLVSTYGVTGERSELSPIVFKALERVKRICTKPVAVGFGVSKREHVKMLSDAGADGIVVGSAVVKLIERYGGSAAIEIAKFTAMLKDALV